MVVRTVLCVMLGLCPLLFGAVHATTYLPIFVLLWAFVGFKGSSISLTHSRTVSWLLAGLCLILFLEVVRSLSNGSPIANRTPMYLLQWFGLLLPVLLYSVLHTEMSEHDSLRRFTRTVILVSGGGVALVGLMHWFTDNGKLFWYFAPDEVFVSTRARWPFVNSNHLAHYLTIPLFLALARARTLLYRIPRAPAGASRDKLLVRSMLAATVFLAILLATIGTLSRGAWFGIIVGALVWFTVERRMRAREESANQGTGGRASRGSWRTVGLLLVTTLIVGTLFISSRGASLIEERIRYGLTASRDDLRWILYRDSISIFTSHPLLGVGLGRWEIEHAPRASEEITDLDPEYLHSDPFQMLLEVGILGIAPWCMALGFAVVGARRQLAHTVPTLSESRRSTVFACLAGVIGVIVASFVDFPFRIPAVVWMVVAALALASASLLRSK